MENKISSNNSDNEENIQIHKYKKYPDLGTYIRIKKKEPHNQENAVIPSSDEFSNDSN